MHFFGASSCSKTIQTSSSWPAKFCTCTWVLANININFHPSLMMLNDIGMLQQHHIQYFPKRSFCYKKVIFLLIFFFFSVTAANHPFTMIVLSVFYPILLGNTVCFLARWSPKRDNTPWIWAIMTTAFTWYNIYLLPTGHMYLRQVTEANFHNSLWCLAPPSEPELLCYIVPGANLTFCLLTFSIQHQSQWFQEQWVIFHTKSH